MRSKLPTLFCLLSLLTASARSQPDLTSTCEDIACEVGSLVQLKSKQPLLAFDSMPIQEETVPPPLTKRPHHAIEFPMMTGKDLLHDITLQHYREVSRHLRKHRADVFHSIVPLDPQALQDRRDRYVGVCKILDADSQKPMPTMLEKRYYDNDLQPVGKGQILGVGEDPRAFIFNGTAYAQSWSPAGGNNDHFVVNLQSGERHNLNKCPVPGGGFRGKNWVPLVIGATYYVAVRVHPQLVVNKYDFASKQCTSAPEFSVPKMKTTIDGKLVQGSVSSAVTQFRGGTAFVQVASSLYLAVGHRTVDPSIHRPYLMFLDISKHEYNITQISSLSGAKGILDPASLWVEDGSIMMAGVKTKGVWHNLYYAFDKSPCGDCHFDNSVYKVNGLPEVDSQYSSSSKA